jgi:hypothetical protein
VREALFVIAFLWFICSVNVSTQLLKNAQVIKRVQIAPCFRQQQSHLKNYYRIQQKLCLEHQEIQILKYKASNIKIILTARLFYQLTYN